MDKDDLLASNNIGGTVSESKDPHWAIVYRWAM